MVNVVITGSSKGIGFGLANEFARRGHQVVLTGSSESSVADAMDHLADSERGKIFGRAVEVSSEEEMQALWDFAREQMGQINIWINNAGIARTGHSIIDLPGEQIQAMIQSNILGGINGSRVAVRGMREQGHGKLFNMLGGGSDGEYFPGMGVYGTTKRAMDYLTRALVKEHRDSALIIGRIRPGMVVTEGVVREARANPQAFAAGRKIMNRLCDQVETVAPYLVDQVLACEKTGSKIAWLNGRRIASRMLFGRFQSRPDQFEAHGL